MLPALLLGYFSLGLDEAVTVNLYRGAPTGGEHRYWAVTDTYLDSTEPDKPMGGLFTLSGGKGRTILVRFGDLDSVIPAGSKITKATLYLSPSSPEKPELAGAFALKASWGEGPMFVARQSADASTAIRGAATWKHRKNGDGSGIWQEAGGVGAADATPIPGAKMETGETDIAVTGLAETVQGMRDHWYENHGFALTFTGNCEFFSSQAKLGKPKLVVEYEKAPVKEGPDLSVLWIDRTPQNPKDGETVTYRAVVKNVGKAPAANFSAQWFPGAKSPTGRSLAPGEQAVIESQMTYKRQGTIPTLGFRAIAAEPDVDPSNDAVFVNENALSVAVTGKASPDEVQRWARLVNETYFAQSRFSFAPEGVVERIRIVPESSEPEYTIEWDGEEGTTRRLLQQLTGLKPVEGEAVAKSGDRDIPYGDPYAGISGFGDTRFDGLIPPGIPMLYVPVANPLFDNMPIEATDLLSGTEVASINSGIGKKGKARLGIVWDLPATIILRAVDMTGKPLNGAELSFFQIDDGKMPDTPTQTILTKEGGTVIVDNRDPIVSTIDKDALHQPKRSPFGALRADGSNSTILVRALINGEVEWSWIKAWQLVDSYYRGNKAAAIVDVRFNAPSGTLDNATNLAKGRLATDSANSLPAKLAALTDDNLTNEATLGAKKGDWIEIDLGRDRPIGEIRLVFKTPTMPNQFDIQLYATGQNPPETDAWVKDLEFKWTLANRGIKAADGTVSIPYRGPLARGRYIRIVNRSGGEGQIAEVRVIPLKAE